MGVEDNTKAIMISIGADNEERLAQAIEAISRPLTGLILDGMTVVFSRADLDE